MSPRTGRPPSDNPKSVLITVKIDKKTNEDLVSYAERHRVTRAEAVRSAILKLLGLKK